MLSLVLETCTFNNKYYLLGDNNARRRAKAKATDLLEHKVEVHVLSFNQHFKYDPFYKV